MLITRYSNEATRQRGKVDFAAAMTKAASKQTYYTIRFLVDRDRVQNAYRAYAYFRWVDDRLDCSSDMQEAKNAFLLRQRTLLEACYRKESTEILEPEEQMLVDLVKGDQEKDSGLQLYLRNMMEVMAFDTKRCGQVISETELTHYSHLLSKAVTEALFYFIGNGDPPPCTTGRYQAVYGAHVVHMLRDLVMDIDVGYINIPVEILESEQIDFADLNSQSLRNWVFSRVKLAQRYFDNGRVYIAQVKNLRCRLAGFAYLARFEWMLKTIERDDYCLRQDYSERKRFKASMWIVWRTFISLLRTSKNEESVKQINILEQCEEE